MSNKLVSIVVLVLLSATSFGQELKCKKFKTGTFVIPGDSRVPQSKLIRNKTTQIESLSTHDVVELDIKWVDDCNYILKLSATTPENKISEVEKMIDREGGLRIEMLRTAKDTMFFKATAKINGVDHPIEGYQIKVSKDY
ncbi:hypothetical protein [Psychroserpens damuponensis]|uniref:hypothetical protein n=1 Tax=Psychroserpens damuponensis TaxID=943936 RepID=UPI00058BDBDC|nr:hypothetical protein [Psychroserpens damuponensis]